MYTTKLYKKFTSPKLTIPKLFNIAETLSCFNYATIKQLKNTLSLTLINSKYITQYNILYSYYIWMTSNKELKIANNPIERMSTYPIKYICFYLKLEAFPYLIDLKNEEEWWTKSFTELSDIKELDDINNQRIIENWILNICMNPYGITRQHIILLETRGKRLLKYLSEQS